MITVPTEKIRKHDESPGKRRLVREIAIVIVIKLLVLSVLFVLFFSPAQRPQIDTDSVRQQLIGNQDNDKGAKP